MPKDTWANLWSTVATTSAWRMSRRTTGLWTRTAVPAPLSWTLHPSMSTNAPICQSCAATATNAPVYAARTWKCMRRPAFIVHRNVLTVTSPSNRANSRSVGSTTIATTTTMCLHTHSLYPLSLSACVCLSCPFLSAHCHPATLLQLSLSTHRMQPRLSNSSLVLSFGTYRNISSTVTCF